VSEANAFDSKNHPPVLKDWKPCFGPLLRYWYCCCCLHVVEQELHKYRERANLILVVAFSREPRIQTLSQQRQWWDWAFAHPQERYWALKETEIRCWARTLTHVAVVFSIVHSNHVDITLLKTEPVFSQVEFYSARVANYTLRKGGIN
jgi:hypothetical protein